MAVERLDDAQLSASLAVVLEQWPLYRRFSYSGSQIEYLPTEISLFCTNQKCEKQQLWSRKSETRFSDKSGWRTVEYIHLQGELQAQPSAPLSFPTQSSRTPALDSSVTARRSRKRDQAEQWTWCRQPLQLQLTLIPAWILLI